MDFTASRSAISPSSSSLSSTPHRPPDASSAAGGEGDPMHSWWESVSKQRSRLLSLSDLLSAAGDAEGGSLIVSLADSDRPAISLLSSAAAYSAVSSIASDPRSGSGSDPLCQWLYETYLSLDPQLRLVVLSFLPLVAGVYLSRIHSTDSSSSSLPSLSGFEAVLLAIYAGEVKSRAGKPILVQVPDLSQPSLYHTPRVSFAGDGSGAAASVGVVSPPLEPQIAVKSTKRAGIVGVALHCYFKEISQMPAWSKIEFCRFASDWAGQDCHCRDKIDDADNEIRTPTLTNGFGDSAFSNGIVHEVEIEEEMTTLAIKENGEPLKYEAKGVRIPLPWELLQPALRIIGHCLLGPLNAEDVKDAASAAVRSLYARASHDLNPQAILAARSLVNLDKSSRAAAKAESTTAAATNSSSSANTPSKAKKPEILLASK